MRDVVIATLKLRLGVEMSGTLNHGKNAEITESQANSDVGL